MADTLLALAFITGSLLVLHRRENAFALLTEGAAEGLKMAARMLPSLVILLSAVSALRGSGFLEWASSALGPLLELLGSPPETLLLMLVRPFSGSAALVVGGELIVTYGPDSRIGRTAAVMLGSTETTFYVLSVYAGACGIRDVRHAPAAALIADAVGFLTAAATVRLFFP